LVAHKLVLQIAAHGVVSADADLLERQQLVVGPLPGDAEDKLVLRVKEPLDVLRLSEPSKKTSVGVTGHTVVVASKTSNPKLNVERNAST